MSVSSSLHALQEQAEAAFLPYGPPEQAIQLVETFGPYEAEYAAIRKGVGILHQPHRGLVELTGSQRGEFLHRFVSVDTQELATGKARRGLLLTAKGRIAADLLIVQQAERTLLGVDRLNASGVAEELDKFLFAEDVQIADRSDEVESVALHGPAAASLLHHAGAEGKTAAASLEPLTGAELRLCGESIPVARYDETGALGLHLWVPRASAEAVYQALTEPCGGLVPDLTSGEPRAVTGRGIGWAAFNAARIEAGTPLYHIDFGPDTLPHETGELLREVVDFAKGCYRGQEVVARMDALGHPKRVLVGLRFADDRMPVAGTAIHAATESPTDAPGEPIGAVTSSTLSPMLGGLAVAFGMIKWGSHEPGTRVEVPAEGERVPATVGSLRFV